MSEKEKKENPQPIKKEKGNLNSDSQKEDERAEKSIDTETAKGGIRGG